jgi:hypothetical protein
MQDLHLPRIVGGVRGGSRIDKERYLSSVLAVRTRTAELLQPGLGAVPAMFANKAAIPKRPHGTELEADYAVRATNAYEGFLNDRRIHNANSLLQPVNSRV